jgi:hypothetical protein
MRTEGEWLVNVYEIEATTDGSGDATEELLIPHGEPQLLYGVEWVDGDFADGVDAVLSCTGPSGVKRTLLTLTNANDDAMYYPRELEDDNVGAESTGYTMAIVNGTLELVVSSGGASKTGKCRVYTVEV